MKKPANIRTAFRCELCDIPFRTRNALKQHSLDKGHPVICSICNNKPFPTPSALVQHCQAKRHPYCRPCHRFFVSAAALGQHQRDTLAHTASNTNVGIATAPTPAQPPVTCRGNTYTALSLAEQATLYTQLLAHCHTRDRLQREGYPLEPSARHLPTPTFNPADPARHKAVVLDCEMVGTASGTDEVISLSLIDFFTGTPLLSNVLVHPDPAGDVRITDWRSDITGVTPAMLSVATVRGEALRGREAARAALWKYVNAETVVVGHSVNYDLHALGVVHTPGRVVDSAILTAEAFYGREGKITGRFAGLERLCRELVGLRIRGGNDNKNGSGGGRHDSMEDVLAAREVVIWCLRHPAELKAWAAENWKEKSKSKSKRGRKKKKEGQGSKPARAARGLSSGGSGGGWYDDDSDEVLRWSDVVDYDTWPKSPPDWSD